MTSRRRSSPLPRIFLAIILIMAIVASVGIYNRRQHLDTLTKEAHATSVQKVIGFNPLVESATSHLVLPGNVIAFKDATLYARSPGYLRRWFADIGTKVKRNDLIAQIETPELDAQVRQAQSDLTTAQANYDLAQTTAVRWQALIKTRTVSVQDLENKLGDAASKKALVEAARAHLQQLTALQSFEQIRAPFAGTVSVRNVDIGDLVAAGSSGRELFHLVDKRQLRIYVQVPQAQAPYILPGAHADMIVPEHPGKHFKASVIKIAGALDTTTRTVMVELLYDNPDELVNPGDFVNISFTMPMPQSDVRIPVTALIFRGDGLQVALVDARHHVQLVTVVPGRDFGKNMEILSGINQHDTLIDNPPDSIVDGEPVQIASMRTLKDEKK
ncbi:MAG: efflux RND transporter periplasmic adaptor subunit [Burkholderiales bacterium]